jgi:hypothetical protein
METRLELEMLPQPDDTTCGPTCLHAVYRYYDDRLPLRELIDGIESLETGGTLAVSLACHALRRGYGATIYTYNLALFDPTWFPGPVHELVDKLEAQRKVKTDPKLLVATDAYLEFLELGGDLQFHELTPGLIANYLKRGHPVLTGLSATYLYGCARESGHQKPVADDVAGEPVGHFVVLYGYDAASGDVHVADPLQDNPPFGSHYYSVNIARVLGAVLLGVLTSDANLLIIEPPEDPDAEA